MTDAHEQKWSPEQYAENARFVSELGMPVVDLLSPQPGERILDLGCGDGALTVKLLQLGCDVVGIDSSPDMIAAAKALGVNAQVMDGAALPFESEFDAVFSNAALHWIKDQESVIDGVWRALKPGGRFVGEFGGYGNVSTVVDAIESVLLLRHIVVPNSWFLPRPEAYRSLLEARGFAVEHIDLIPRPTPLPGGIGGWLETFAQPYTCVLPTTERKRFISDVIEALRPVLCDSHGNWEADYVRLRFAAVKPMET